MHMKSLWGGLLLSIGAGAALPAQAPVGGAGPARPNASVAQFFLAHTAQLQLNDQQVTRLAAIARRSETREQARRATFDSLRARFGTAPADSAGRAARRTELANTMRTAMERARDERHADLRDALAVLNADQQARAWELRGGADRGPRARAAGRAFRRDEMGRGRGAGRDGMRRGVRSGMRRPL
jgi:hypothetical protein